MLSITNTMPEAYAKIKGNKKYPNLKGTVSFYGVHGGTIVVAEVTGLPENSTFHGFHIHEGENTVPEQKQNHFKMQERTIILKTHNIQIMRETCRHYWRTMEPHSVHFILTGFIRKM